MIYKIKNSSVNGEITAPSSKSFAQRALAIASLAKGRSVIENIESGSDVDAVLALVSQLGASVNFDQSTRRVELIGRASDSINSDFFIGESGLATRLFTPIASLFDMPITISGHKTILTRPMNSMQKPLESAGVKFESNNGYLPLTITGPIKGGVIEVDGSLSSQFITGLLIALPLCEEDTTLVIDNLMSKPYIDMTLECVAAANVEIENQNYTTFKIKGGQEYTPINFNVEGDWSGASCLLVAGATSGSVTMHNLSMESTQADAKIMEALESAGARIHVSGNSVTVEKSSLKSFEFDATHCPDLFPALAALAAACSGESTIIGTSRLTHKESDRAQTIKTTFETLGVNVDISQENIMKISGAPIKGGVSVDSFGDHRIAMAAAVAALNASGEVTITRAEAVSKSYTNFWNDFESVLR
ncbi:MAG: 3-phosphoshikimate 1-carboxyvinyltransferase [Rikenellaceae bacterium]